jgi:hypothetical protein
VLVAAALSGVMAIAARRALPHCRQIDVEQQM